MNRLALAALLLALAACAAPEKPRAPQPPPAAYELIVGFWNIRDFSFDDPATAAKEGSRTPDELKTIAQIAKNFDCFAVCELNDKVVLGELCKELAKLGGQWGAVQTEVKAGNTPASSEYYGFVYRSDRLKTRSSPRILPKVLTMPAGESPREFDREPAVCSFATLDGRLDFTLITVHVTWGTKVEYRKAEIRALKDYFVQVRDGDPADKDVILTGDFNRDVGDSGSLSVLLTIPTMIDTTDAGVPTVVKGTSTYDHILFQTSFVQEYTGRHGVIRFDEDVFAGDDDKAREVGSDHRPVWVVLRVPEQDDD